MPAHQASGYQDDVSVRKFDGLETASVTQALLYADDDDTGAMFLEVLWQCEMAAGGGAQRTMTSLAPLARAQQCSGRVE